MAIGDVAAWRTAFGAMEKVADDSWKANLANTLDGLVTSKLSSPGLFDPDDKPAAVFTFAKSTFQAALSDALPSTLQSALASALSASSIVVPTGSYIGSPGNLATTFSAVASAVLDPTSITAAAAKLLELLNQTPVSDPDQAPGPATFREAFLLLTMTTTGTNSVTPTPGPLTDAARAMA